MEGGSSGTLDINVVEAKLTHDTETFSKMDPFVKVIYNNHKAGQSKVLDGAGKKPKWMYELKLQCNTQFDEIHLEVHDQDVSSSDLVGLMKTKIFNIVGPNGGMDAWHELKYKGKKAGELRLITKWTEKGGAAVAAAPVAPAPAAP